MGFCAAGSCFCISSKPPRISAFGLLHQNIIQFFAIRLFCCDLSHCVHTKIDFWSPPPTVPAKFYQRQGCRSQGEQRYAVCFHSSVLNIINSDESCIRVWYPAPRSCTNCDSGEGKVSRSFRLNSEKGACVSFNRVSILQISTKTSTKLSFSSCELLLQCRNK